MHTGKMPMNNARPSVAHIKAIAFDCYGTLVQFATPEFLQTMEEICSLQQLPIEGKALLDKWLKAARALVEESARRNGHTPLEGDWPEELEATFRPYRIRWPMEFDWAIRDLGLTGDGQAVSDLLRHRLTEAAAYPEVHDVLAALRKSGRYRIALLSNADDDFLLPCLARNRLDSFEAIVSSEAACSYKPHSGIFRRLAQVLELEPAEIAYVGDSPRTDVVGARQAGLKAVWVNRLGQQWPDGVPPPELEVHDFRELLELLEGE